ncbi:MAG: hypothetical protein SFY80_09755 [Verrucomicrobiota bacterium]|nr:hypothetical protein [Verrucomicrobiota bacterium]
MSQPAESIFTIKSVIINALLTGVVFLFFTYVLRPFVPDERPVIVWLGSGYIAACLSGVFFLAANMFTAVIKDQRRRASQSRE